jgi:hypothetical protein
MYPASRKIPPLLKKTRKLYQEKQKPFINQVPSRIYHQTQVVAPKKVSIKNKPDKIFLQPESNLDHYQDIRPKKKRISRIPNKTFVPSTSVAKKDQVIQGDIHKYQEKAVPSTSVAEENQVIQGHVHEYQVEAVFPKSLDELEREFENLIGGTLSPSPTMEQEKSDLKLDEVSALSYRQRKRRSDRRKKFDASFHDKERARNILRKWEKKMKNRIKECAGEQDRVTKWEKEAKIWKDNKRFDDIRKMLEH